MDNAIKGLWWVVVEDGRMFMYFPDGTKTYGEVFCEIRDAANEIPKAKFELSVNIASSVEEMNQKIKELELK